MVHHRVHKGQPLVSVLSQMNLVHNSQLIHLIFIQILSSHLSLGVPSGLLLSDFQTKISYTLLISPVRTTDPHISSSLI
jgi:hypothetical protein